MQVRNASSNGSDVHSPGIAYARSFEQGRSPQGT
jgi:hypothetical protein